MTKWTIKDIIDKALESGTLTQDCRALLKSCEVDIDDDGWIVLYTNVKETDYDFPVVV